MATVFIIVVTATNAFLLRKIPWWTPIRLFTIFNGIMALGTVQLLDAQSTADQDHLLIILLTMCLYALFSYIASSALSLQRLNRLHKASFVVLKSRKILLFSFVLFIISAIASFVYFSLVGYNVFLLGLTGALTEGEATDLRLASYSGSTYFAPGYFNQFKNVLLPVSFLSISSYISTIRINIAIKFMIALLFLIPVIIFLAGTGHRVYIAIFLLTALVYWRLIGINAGSSASLKIKKIIITLLATSAFILAFGFISSLLGRTEEFTLGSTFEQLAKRLLEDNQSASVIGFRYVYGQPVQLGTEWIKDILGILPGDDFRGSDLPSTIFSIRYGSYRGTSPVSIWTSVYYNFGWAGIVAFPALLAFFNAYFTSLFFKFRVATTLDLSFFAFAFCSLSSWIAGSPMRLMNNGFVICALFLLISSIFRIGKSKKHESCLAVWPSLPVKAST